jgi:hypothetical protein
MCSGALLAQDWQSFVMFNDHHYVRHLVDANDDFELMVRQGGPSLCFVNCVLVDPGWRQLEAG